MTACLPPKDVVATIDGKAITKTEVRERLQAHRLKSGDETVPPNVLSDQFASAKAVLNQIINERLLLFEAQRQNLVKKNQQNPERCQDAMRQVLSELGKEVPFPSLKEARVFYEKHPEKFTTNTRYQLEHLLLDSENAAWELKEEIDKGLTSLTEAGRKQLFGARIADSGKNRLISANELPPGITEILPSLKPGKLSSVIATPYGYHLIRIVKTLPAGKIPFPEVENRIKDTIFAQRLHENYQHWLKQSREQHKIQIFHQHLTEL